jgi:dihydropteroate synthase
MQDNPRYQDVVVEVRDFLIRRTTVCEEAGISLTQLLIDPGFGFGKSFEHNRRLMAELDVFAALGPLLAVGLSRKGFVAALLGDLECDGDIGSAGLAMLAAQKGAQVVRVHDVAITRDLIRVLERVNANGDDVQKGSDEGLRV